PRCVPKHPVAPAGVADARRLDRLAAALVEPGGPGGPPGAGVDRLGLGPGPRIDVLVAGLAGGHLVAALGMRRAADDAGVVAAAGEQEGYLRLGEAVHLVHRGPGG